MKNTAAILFASCLISLAQTNTDSSGYVTNAALLTPFTLTNSEGNVFTDAVFVKITANKFIYKAGNGTMGTKRLDTLPPELLARIGYDPSNAAAADFKEQQQKEALRRQQELDRQQRARDALVQEVLKSQEKITGDVIQKIDAGLLLTTPGRAYPDVPYDEWRTILLADYPNTETAVAKDQIFANGFPIGTFSYTTVNNSQNTIRMWTCDTNRAVEYYIEHGR